MRKNLACLLLAIGALLGMQLAFADIIVPMNVVENGQGTNIGTVSIQSYRTGVLITPNLHNLTPGIHGFHIHQSPSCDNKGMAAGGHLDPGKTDEHNGPYIQKGHLGDLPVLVVNKNGSATLPVFAPKIALSELKNHALMIHVNGDNYSDKPEKLGGGGPRYACGIIK